MLRPGTDVTLVTHGVLVNQALEAARLLEERGVSAEVVKLNLLCPPALDVPLASLGRTGRLLCAEEVCRPGSMGNDDPGGGRRQRSGAEGQQAAGSGKRGRTPRKRGGASGQAGPGRGGNGPGRGETYGHRRGGT